MGRCVMVIGPHRSGSSAVAGVLHRLGVQMGTRLLEADPSNPYGYYEDRDWLDLNYGLVGDWTQPKISRPTLREQLRIRSLVAKRRRFRYWGCKDPRFCITGRWVWPAVKSNLCIIHTNRPIVSRIDSLLTKHPGMDREHVEWVAALCMVERRKNLEHCPVTPLDVSYDTLVVDPIASVKRIAEHVFLPADQPDIAHILEAAKFIDPSLRHYRS